MSKSNLSLLGSLLATGALVFAGCGGGASGGGTGGKTDGGGTGGRGTGGSGAGGFGTGGKVDGGTGGMGAGGTTTDGGTGGMGAGGTTTDGGTGGTTDGGGDGSTGDRSTDGVAADASDGGPAPCGGCINFSIPFTAGGQGHSLATVFGGTDGADLHGATITLRVRATQAGLGGAIQFYPQDIAYHSDYGHGIYASPIPATWTELVYHVPAPLTEPDGGAILYDTTKIRQLQFEVDSMAPPAVDAGADAGDGGADAAAPTYPPTIVQIDSIVITGAPPPPGGGSYSPYSFDQNIFPFGDNGANPSGSTVATITWVP